MTKRFRVWCPEDGETVADARRISAFDAEEAAEFWGERDDAESAEYQIAGKGVVKIVVVVADDGVQSRFSVSGEAVPTYSAFPEPVSESGEHVP